MKRAKIVLASLFAVLMIVGLSQPASAPEANPDLVIEPHGLDATVSTTFSVDIWIKNIPDVMYGFQFRVDWDPSMMEVTSGGVNFIDHGFVCLADDLQDGYYAVAAESIGNPETRGRVGTDEVWLTLTFHCKAEGSSYITATNYEWPYNPAIIWYAPAPSTLDPDAITVNQVKPRPVGGVVVPTNKLEILTPYLALAGLVAAVSAVVVVKKRR